MRLVHIAFVATAVVALVGCSTAEPTETPISPTPTVTFVTPIPTSIATTAPTVASRCAPSYPTVCIPPPPPDLDCGQIPFRRFKVVGSDPHHFDRDRDGVGCES